MPHDKIFRSLGAGLTLLITLSLANAVGGKTQWIILLCLGIPALIGLRRAPILVPLVLAIGVLIALLSASLNHTSLIPSLQIMRPLLEGGIAALVVFTLFGVSTWRQFASALAVYVAVQVAIAVLMMLYPDFKDSLTDAIYANQTYDIAAFRGAIEVRGFGISRHHLYGLPLAAGLCVVVLSVVADEEKKWPNLFIVSACLALLIVLMNARTGLLPPVLAMGLGLIFLKIRHYFSVATLACFGAASIVGLPVIFGERGALLQHWLLGGATQFMEPDDVARGATTVSDLASMVHTPDTWQALALGLGQVCAHPSDCYTDIGYLRLLQMGGVGLIIVMAALTILIGLEIWKSTRLMRMASRVVVTFGVLVSIGLALIKGDAYLSSDFSRLIYAMFFMSFFINASSSGPQPAEVIARWFGIENARPGLSRDNV